MKSGGWDYNWIGEFGEKDNFRWDKINKTGDGANFMILYKLVKPRNCIGVGLGRKLVATLVSILQQVVLIWFLYSNPSLLNILTLILHCIHMEKEKYPRIFFSRSVWP